MSKNQLQDKLIYLKCLLLSYLTLVVKYRDFNLLKYFPYDYYELQAEAYRLGKLGLDSSVVENLSKYLFVDMTYLGDQVFINNGQLISFLYLLTMGIPKVVLFVFVLGLFYFYVYKLLNEKWNLLLLLVFSPFTLLVFEVDLFSEISTWYALTALLAQFYHSMKFENLKENKDLILLCLFGVLSPWIRFEYIIISIGASFFPYFSQRSFKSLIPLMGSVGSTLLLLMHNFFIYKMFPSFGDSYGRYHDNFGNYLDFLADNKFLELVERIYFNLINLFLDQRLFGFSNGQFNQDYQHYSNYSLALFLTCFVLIMIFVYKFKKYRTSVSRSDRYWLILALGQFLIISLVTETFFLRYSISYIIVVFIVLLNYLRLSLRESLGVFIGLTIGLISYQIFILNFNFNNLKLSDESFVQRLKDQTLEEYSNNIKLNRNNNYHCSSLSDKERHFYLKGITYESKKCLLGSNLITPFWHDGQTKCFLKLDFHSYINCSKIRVETSDGRDMTLFQMGEEGCRSSDLTIIGYNIFYISSLENKKNEFYDFNSIGLECGK